MILLFISELNTFLTVKVSSEMFIDEARGGDKVDRADKLPFL